MAAVTEPPSTFWRAFRRGVGPACGIALGTATCRLLFHGWQPGTRLDTIELVATSLATSALMSTLFAAAAIRRADRKRRDAISN